MRNIRYVQCYSDVVWFEVESSLIFICHLLKYLDLSKFVSCRSFGVVLWELLTGEIPYKDVDSSAIIWGVGSNSLHLPVPSTCPDGFKILMKQTW